MRLILLIALLAIAIKPNFSQAASSVTVLWKVHFTTPTGPGIFSVPSESQTSLLRRCGFEPKLNAQPDLIPVSTLRCPGVLDLTSNKAIRQRIDHRLSLVEQQGHSAVKGIPINDLRRSLRQIDFGIARFGVYFSQTDGLGTARYMGLNVAETKLVILNKPFWDQLTDVEGGDAFLLHESLGAMAFEDTDYTLSTLLFSMSQTPHKDGDGDDSDGHPTQVASNEGGGASVVGRGGDPNQLFFKASLLKAAEKPIQIQGADPRLTPTAAELKQVINETPITVAPKEFFADGKLCDDPLTGTTSRFFCGGFVLKGAQGKPFLLITREWAEFSATDRIKLLDKIFKSIIIQLVKAKQQQ